MRQGTKIGIALVVGIVAAAGFVGYRSYQARQNVAVEVRPPEPAAPVLAESAAPDTSETPAPELQPILTTESAQASPQPIGVQENAERSFRARPVEPSPEAVTTAPAERTGLAEVTSLAPASDALPIIESDGASVPPSEPIPAWASAEAPAGPATEKTSAEPAAEKTPATPQTTEHVLQPGETFTSLAIKYLGGARHVALIAKANPGKDPRRLHVGSKIKIPAAPAPAVAAVPQPADTAKTTSAVSPEPAAPVAPDRAYKVKAGESWQDLAGRFLRDRARWTELYELNKERVPRNPERLPNGTVIELPKGVSTSSKPA